MKYIAHRGLSSKYKQNTVEAIQSGYHGVEIDIQLCKRVKSYWRMTYILKMGL